MTGWEEETSRIGWGEDFMKFDLDRLEQSESFQKITLANRARYKSYELELRLDEARKRWERESREDEPR